MNALAAIVAIASVTQGPAAITLDVVIAANGSVTLDGRAMRDDAELSDRARAAAEKSPKVTALIHANKNVQYRRVIAVMDALRRGGVSDIAFSVP